MRWVILLALVTAGCLQVPGNPDCGSLSDFECWETLYGNEATRTGSANVPLVIVDSEFHVEPRTQGDAQANPAFLFHCGGAEWNGAKLNLWLDPFQTVPEAVIMYRAHPDADWSHVDSFDSDSDFVATPKDRADIRALFDADRVLHSADLDESALHLPGHSIHPGDEAVARTSHYTAQGYQDSRFDVQETQHIQYAGVVAMKWTMGAFYCD